MDSAGGNFCRGTRSGWGKNLNFNLATATPAP